MKIGIIRCQQTEDLCPGSSCFSFAREGKGAFAGLGAIEVVGFVSCGGCPGKRAVARAKLLVQRGAEAIVFGSCVLKGAPYNWPCPNGDSMKAAIRSAIPGNVQILDYTH